jgi:serine-type D-Ala-D-Ala carboxypeptidase/endopeptidase
MKTPLLSLLALSAATVAMSKPPADLQKKLDDFVKQGPGGAAIAWVDADGAVFVQSGTFDSNDSRAITPDTKFEIGSVSKVFTALLLAETERAGKVARNDPAAKYLLPPGDPAQASLAKITLLSLVTHTSGLPRMPTNMGADIAKPDPYANYDRARLVEALRTDGPGAPVGKAVAYSNFGAAVLGEALAAAWQTSYADALTQHVLVPLGLKSTSLGLAGSPVPADLAPGHVSGKLVPNWTFTAFAPAGALRSSARDLAVFLRACLGGENPLRGSIDATQQPQSAVDDLGGHIGLAWFFTDDPAVPVAWHNGATAGSHSFVGFSRKTGVGIAILSNIQQGSEPLGFALLGTQAPKPKTEVVREAAAYVGRYPLNPAFKIDVTEANGSLFIQASGQPKFALREIAPDRFAVSGVPAEISFERDAAGKVAKLVLHQNGMDQPAPRQELPPPAKEITLPVAVLHEYAGDFPIIPSFVLTVSEENGALFVQATGQPKLPVFASAPDQFFYKIVDAQITFVRDAGGKVTGLVLHQGGRDLPAKKDAK